MPRFKPLDTAGKSKLSVRNLNFFYGKFHALKNVNMELPGEQGHRLYRPLWLWQVDPVAAPSTACSSCIQSSARRPDPAGWSDILTTRKTCL